MENKKLTRPMNDRIISGVCAGLANYMNLDPTVMRVIFVLLTLVTAILPCVIAYIAMALIIPQSKY
ncbi:MAG: hypothetical protein DBY16_12865 [Coprobacter sp.]|jgi:phage shock protein C, pspC|nr:PspC domain-containing protein [Barnesiella sp. GGCC_0306]MBS7039555.1 PspC domain-containing protein [Bacteroidales bacterium]PWM88458.1 MAG: hypothetical protein DBY16_12865 [Coprobacter sp.]